MLHLKTLLLCTPCGEVELPENYQDCDIEQRKRGASRFALVKCDYEFTDILDADEWETAIGANDIAVSPEGIVTINEPSADAYIVTGCGKKKVGEIVYNIQFETFATNKDLSDYDYFIKLFKHFEQYRLVLVDCNEIFHLTPAWASLVKYQDSEAAVIAAETSPGFPFSVITPPFWAEGEGGKGKWTIQFEVITAEPFNGVYLPGVAAELQ